MADKKISELTNATLPLSGNEKLAIVQDSETKKIEVTDLFDDSETKINLISVNEMESYGDSITVGQGSTDDNYYAKLFSDIYSFNLTNRAVSARGVYEAAKLHNANFTPLTKALTTLMAGFNDVRRGGNDAKTIAKINNCVKSIIVNCFLNNYTIANSTQTGVTKSGFTGDLNGSLIGGKSNSGLSGAFSNTINDYIEYIFVNDNVVIGTFASDGTQIFGDFEVEIDGVSQGIYNLNNQSDGISDGSNNNERVPAVLVFQGLGNGEHTIRITNNSNDYVLIDYFGNLEKPNLSKPLILCHATKMNADGYATAPSNASDVIIDELNAIYTDLSINFLTGDYPIYLAKTNDYFDVSTGLSVDNIHPNNEGYFQITQALYEGFKNALLQESSVNTILSDDNTWTGQNEFNEEVLNKKAVQIQGTFDGVPTGEGIEFEYLSGTTYISSLNRTGTTWKPMVFRASSFDFKDNNVSLPSGTFTSNDGKTITVTNGLITSIV